MGESELAEGGRELLLRRHRQAVARTLLIDESFLYGVSLDVGEIYHQSLPAVCRPEDAAQAVIRRRLEGLSLPRDRAEVQRRTAPLGEVERARHCIGRSAAPKARPGEEPKIDRPGIDFEGKVEPDSARRCAEGCNNDSRSYGECLGNTTAEPHVHGESLCTTEAVIRKKEEPRRGECRGSYAYTDRTTDPDRTQLGRYSMPRACGSSMTNPCRYL
jgi:hypothetical protein